MRLAFENASTAMPHLVTTGDADHSHHEKLKEVPWRRLGRPPAPLIGNRHGHPHGEKRSTGLIQAFFDVKPQRRCIAIPETEERQVTKL